MEESLKRVEQTVFGYQFVTMQPGFAGAVNELIYFLNRYIARPYPIRERDLFQYSIIAHDLLCRVRYIEDDLSTSLTLADHLCQLIDKKSDFYNRFVKNVANKIELIQAKYNYLKPSKSPTLIEKYNYDSYTSDLTNFLIKSEIWRLDEFGKVSKHALEYSVEYFETLRRSIFLNSIEEIDEVCKFVWWRALYETHYNSYAKNIWDNIEELRSFADKYFKQD